MHHINILTIIYSYRNHLFLSRSCSPTNVKT